MVAEAALGRRVPFGFLFEIRRRFLADFAPGDTDFADLPNYGCAAFNGALRSLMVDYGTTDRGRGDAIGNVRREIDDVRGIMTRNIEGLLERGERIDLLVDKTDRSEERRVGKECRPLCRSRWSPKYFPPQLVQIGRAHV